MKEFPKVFIFFSVTSALLIIFNFDFPNFVYTIAYVILFFSLVSIIVLFITNPNSFSMFLRKTGRIYRKTIKRITKPSLLFNVDEEDEDQELKDLTRMNLKEQLLNINQHISNPSPFTLAGKEMQNKQLKMDLERLQILQDNFKQMNENQYDFSEMKNSILSEEELADYYSKKTKKHIEHNLEMQDLDFEHRKQAFKTEAELRKLEIDRTNQELAKEEERINKKRQEIEYRKQEVEHKKKEIERYVKETEDYLDLGKHIDMVRAYADAHLTNARTIREIDLADFFVQFVNSGMISEMPKHMQAYLVQMAMNPKAEPREFGDFDMIEKFKEFYEKDLERKSKIGDIEADMKGIDRDSKKNQYDLDKEHLNYMMHEFKGSYKSNGAKN
jgi:hypothetical protein